MENKNEKTENQLYLPNIADINSVCNKNNFITKPHNKHIICIDGNIYSGKTEYINMMKKYFNHEYVDFFIDTTPENNINIIYYTSNSTNNINSSTFFTLQLNEIITYVNNIMNSTKLIIFIEKFLLINKKIYIIYAKNKGLLNDVEYDLLIKIINTYSDYIYGHNNTYVLILKTDINVCYDHNYNNASYYNPVLNYNTISYIHNCYNKVITELKESIQLKDINRNNDMTNYMKSNIKMYFIDFTKDIKNNEIVQNEIVEKLITELPILKNYINSLSKSLFNSKEWITVTVKKSNNNQTNYLVSNSGLTSNLGKRVWKK